MISRRRLAALAFVLVSTAGAVACSGGTAAEVDAGDSDAAIDVDAGAPSLVNLRLTTVGSPHASATFPLVPAFSPAVHDYYVRCPAGKSSLEVSLTASRGAEGAVLSPARSPFAHEQTFALDVRENQAVVAAARDGSGAVEYWVRCLPRDFPISKMVAHPAAGAPPPGYYLVGTFSGSAREGGYAMVLDREGVPVWYHREVASRVWDVDDVVDGAISFSLGSRFEVHEFRPAATTTAAPTGTHVDGHELQVLSNGDYLVFSNPPQRGVDLTGLSIPEGDGGTLALSSHETIVGCKIVEFDPKTGAVLWTWNALDHFDPKKATVTPILLAETSFGVALVDAFHCNSIDVDPSNGNLLVSARQMSSIFYVERPTGTVLWKMGGHPASLDHATYIPVASPFDQQHDARLQPGWSSCTGGQVSLFDDETGRKGPARAVVYDVVPGGGGTCNGGAEGGAPQATVAWQHTGTGPSPAAGSFRISADGSRVIGWGLQRGVVFTEVDDKGNELLELLSGPSYRAIKVPLTALDLNAMRATAGAP